MNNIGRIRTIFELVLIAIIITLLVRPTKIEVKRPMKASMSWRGKVIYKIPTQDKIVALTFDDGPDPRFTPQILDELQKKNVKATFFMVGQEMEKHPDIVKRVIAQGDVIANHTYTHPHDIEADTRAQVIRELERCEEIIESFTGQRAKLFRPPRGLIDGSVFQIAEEEGYTTTLWTVCADHHDAPTPELMAKRVLDHIVPGGIILVHDGRLNSRWKDVKATPLIIDELTKRGYRFVTLPELLAAKTTTHTGMQTASAGRHIR